MISLNQERIFAVLSRPLQPLQFSDGALEALKWLALVSMVYDHVVRFLLSGGNFGPATTFGRIAFPLFAFIIAYNLARPGDVRARAWRVLTRLIVFGLLALPAMDYLVGRVTSLNILFTFAVAVGMIWWWEGEKKWWSALLVLTLFWASGYSVDYGWAGILLTLGFYLWQRGRTVGVAIAFFLIGITWVNMENGSRWALLALPLIWLSSLIDITVPRSKWLFYVFYPAHLTVIVLLSFFLLRQ